MKRKRDSADAATTSIGVDDSDSSSLGTEFEVFLSFRGPDTRDNFADCLYEYLVSNGIRVFRDDEEIRKGESIGDELLSAIKSSKIYLPIFSKNYASSSWCLRELTCMVECWSKAKDKVILPIFYDVSPQDVKLKTPLYLDPLKEHEGKFCDDVILQWKAALTEVAGLAGWDLKDKGQGKIIRTVAHEVLNKLMKRSRSLPDHLVGHDSQVEAVMNLLNEGSHDTRYLVIWGMGGIGKTTLANIIFNRISNQFEHYSFLSDIRESANQGRMIDLQKQLLLDLCHGGQAPNSVGAATNIISERFRDKKILLVLDDLDEKAQLSKLAEKSNWFGSGSKIIITTRNIDFLPIKEEDGGVNSQVHFEEFKFHEMRQMESFYALRLFSRHTFGMDSPPDEYGDISTKITNKLDGLPLALEVVGSSLLGKGMDTWKAMWKKLCEGPHRDVFGKLKISFDMLENNQKQIFLDIACYFIGKKRFNPYYLWKASGFSPKYDILMLTRMSLIKVKQNDTFWMHDQLRDLGRKIVQDEDINVRGKRSRLWESKIALEVVQMKEGTENVVALNLKGFFLDNHNFTSEEFSKLPNLRFLELRGGNLVGNFKNLLPKLTWLSWDFCPSELRATNLCLGKLVVLELSNSEVTSEDWARWGPCLVGGDLKVIRIHYCLDLSRIIEWPKLRTPVIVVDGYLSKLKRLEIHGRHGYQGSNSKPFAVPSTFGDMKCLTTLKLEWMPVRELHHSIRELMHLKVLSLDSCCFLTRLPDSIGELKSLLELNLCNCTGLAELPHSIGGLKMLKRINILHTQIKELPDQIGELESLLELDLTELKITELPSSIGKLKRLEILRLQSTYITELPTAIGMLENLKELGAAQCNIGRLPTTMSQLSHLERLYLQGCRELEQLQELPVSLKVLTFSPHLLRTAPDLSSLTNLVDLKVHNGYWGWPFSEDEQEAPFMNDAAIPSINLATLSRLKNLEIICVGLRFLKGLPSSLETLRLRYVELPTERSLFSNLTNLWFLRLEKCCSLSEVEFDDVLGHQLEKLHTFDVRGDGVLERLSISGLKGLRKLCISQCDRLMEIQGAEKLESLESLFVSNCSSWKRFPHLLGCTKLQQVEFTYCPQLSPEPRDMNDAAFPSINLATLSRLKNLEITCVDLRFLKGLPSSLEMSGLWYVESPMEWSLFSNLTNLSCLKLAKCCNISEVEFDDVSGQQLEKVRTLDMGGDGMLNRLSISGLKGLRRLRISDCNRLIEIQGAEKLESLESLIVSNCSSWKRFPHLSGCTKLRQVEFWKCPQLSPPEPRDIANLPDACQVMVNWKRISTVPSVEDNSSQPARSRETEVSTVLSLKWPWW